MALYDSVNYTNSVGWSAVTSWATGITNVTGDLVKQTGTPTVGSERVFVCIHNTGGTSVTGASDPLTVFTRGNKIVDNTNITWQEATGIAALNSDMANCPDWNSAKNVSISLGAVIKSIDGTKILICTTAGTA